MNWIAKLLIVATLAGMLTACCCFGGLHDTEIDQTLYSGHSEGSGGDV